MFTAVEPVLLSESEPLDETVSGLCALPSPNTGLPPYDVMTGKLGRSAPALRAATTSAARPPQPVRTSMPAAALAVGSGMAVAQASC
ncbi:MAG: hypothetical protein QM820_06710 [Minicystis sp.]